MLAAKMGPSRGGRKTTVPSRFFKIYKNAFSKKKHQKMELPTVRRILAAKMGPSRGGPKTTVPLRFFKIILTF